MSLREYRKLRAQASILLFYVAKADCSEEAWKIYYAWRDGRISYREALLRLKKLAARS